MPAALKRLPVGPLFLGSLVVSCALNQPPPTLSAQPAPTEILQSGEVRPLPGQLDNVPLFNSNSPEWPKQSGILLYSRVAGVQAGSSWRARLVDAGKSTLSTPSSGRSIAYGISTLWAGRLGTEQVQAAPLVVRYPPDATPPQVLSIKTL